MPSSIRMIKSTHVEKSDSIARINTAVKEDVPTSPSKQDDETELKDAEFRSAKKKSRDLTREAEKKSRDLIEEAEQKCKQLLEVTYQEIEELKTNTYNQAYHSGKEAGHQEGYKQGLAQGLKEAEINNEREKAEIQQMYEDTQAAIVEYKLKQKEEWIRLACHMAEKIIHKEIAASDKGILELAKPYFYQLDKNEELVTITVHPSQREEVQNLLPEIESILPNTRFIVRGDSKLEEKGMVIEKSKAVIDLQIKKQLKAILKEFDETERTVDA